MNSKLFTNNSLPSLIDELNAWNFGTFKNLYSNYIPPANVLHNESETIISVSVPGFKKEDIKIELENLSIKISASIKSENTNENFSHKEFYVSSFLRKFKLSEQSDIDNISSSLENGILTIKIPKSCKNIKLIDIQ